MNLVVWGIKMISKFLKWWNQDDMQEQCWKDYLIYSLVIMLLLVVAPASHASDLLNCGARLPIPMSCEWNAQYICVCTGKYSCNWVLSGC